MNSPQDKHMTAAPDRLVADLSAHLPARAIVTDADARGPHRISTEDVMAPAPGMPDEGDEAIADVRVRRVRQVLADPAGDGDWVVEAEVDLDASDRVGEAVVLATAMRRL